MSGFLSGLIISWRRLVGVLYSSAKFTVAELHYLVVVGQISENGLWEHLPDEQFYDFTAYHLKVKQLLEMTELPNHVGQVCLPILEEEPERLLDKNLELRALVLISGSVDLLDPHKRRDYIAGVRLVDGMLERENERSIQYQGRHIASRLT